MKRCTVRQFTGLVTIYLSVVLGLGACYRPYEPDYCDTAAMMLTTANSPLELETDGIHVFYDDGGGIKKIPKDGSAMGELVAGAAFYEFAIDTTHLYWANKGSTTHQIIRLPLAGGDAEVVNDYMTLYLVGNIAIDETDVYFAGTIGASIYKIPKSGGAHEMVVTDLRGVGSMAVDVTHIYWVDRGPEVESIGAIMKAPKEGGTPVVLADGLNRATALVLDESHVYWTNGGVPVPPSGSVMKVPKTGGQVITLIANIYNPFDIAIDSTHVYFTNATSIDRGTIMKVPKTGGNTTVLAECLDFPNSIALDDTHVYWSNLGKWQGGSIMRIGKDGRP